MLFVGYPTISKLPFVSRFSASHFAGASENAAIKPTHIVFISGIHMTLVALAIYRNVRLTAQHWRSAGASGISLGMEENS